MRRTDTYELSLSLMGEEHYVPVSVTWYVEEASGDGWFEPRYRALVVIERAIAELDGKSVDVLRWFPQHQVDRMESDLLMEHTGAVS